MKACADTTHGDDVLPKLQGRRALQHAIGRYIALKLLHRPITRAAARRFQPLKMAFAALVDGDLGFVTGVLPQLLRSSTDRNRNVQELCIRAARLGHVSVLDAVQKHAGCRPHLTARSRRGIIHGLLSDLSTQRDARVVNGRLVCLERLLSFANGRQYATIMIMTMQHGSLLAMKRVMATGLRHGVRPTHFLCAAIIAACDFGEDAVHYVRCIAPVLFHPTADRCLNHMPADVLTAAAKASDPSALVYMLKCRGAHFDVSLSWKRYDLARLAVNPKYPAVCKALLDIECLPDEAGRMTNVDLLSGYWLQQAVRVFNLPALKMLLRLKPRAEGVPRIAHRVEFLLSAFSITCTKKRARQASPHAAVTRAMRMLIAQALVQGGSAAMRRTADFITRLVRGSYSRYLPIPSIALCFRGAPELANPVGRDLFVLTAQKSTEFENHLAKALRLGFPALPLSREAHTWITSAACVDQLSATAQERMKRTLMMEGD